MEDQVLDRQIQMAQSREEREMLESEMQERKK